MPATRVPAVEAPLDVIFRFASTTYFGYDRHGGVEGLSRFANAAADQWQLDRRLSIETKR